MWRTSRGNRILHGAEAELFRAILGYVYEEVDDQVLADDDDFAYISGIGSFDRLTRNQQIALLAEIGTALLNPDCPAPALSAPREAAVAVVFRSLLAAIAFEIDIEGLESESNWRETLVRACQEADREYFDDGSGLPDLSCADLGGWELLVDSMANRILWDRDWELEDLVADSNPAESADLKRRLTIDEDYFTAVPPDPPDAELDALRRQLDCLIGSGI